MGIREQYDAGNRQTPAVGPMSRADTVLWGRVAQSRGLWWGSWCRISILRNGNVACLCRLNFPSKCPLSNLRIDHVPCHYPIGPHVAVDKVYNALSNLRNSHVVLSILEVKGHSVPPHRPLLSYSYWPGSAPFLSDVVTQPYYHYRSALCMPYSVRGVTVDQDKARACFTH